MGRELMHTEEWSGWTIRLYACPEDHDWHDDFEKAVIDMTETEAMIESGEWMLCVACVTAGRGGIELGTEYLSSCMYKPGAAAFITGGYYEKMRTQAVLKAEQTLVTLNTPV